MKIYQPMMFVGLGGTGCLVGTELERRLRDTLCGPDGTLFSQQTDGRVQPYQLPSCLQFVYADFSEGQLNRLPYRQVDESLRAAYSRTSQATQALLPKFDSSIDVTARLRNALPGAVRGWLPPSDSEPSIAPLHDGAGQLPTVGRACMFEAIRTDLTPAVKPIRDAISAIVNSGAELRTLGGNQRTQSCDVFVAFSVAGGTGAGIFYDYLHLIANEFDRYNLRVRIYPLVMMPSAFADIHQNNRPAELNAGRALVDLFRLVDSQNSPRNDENFDDAAGARTEVFYSNEGRIEKIGMRPSTVQTAFLFNKTAGIGRTDLHRSVVSMIMSLIGTEPDNSGQRHVADDQPQSFADNFINGATRRASVSATGIGRRGVSTGLVASMTVPAEELAEIMAARLLSTAVFQLDDRARRDANGNRELIRKLFAESGVEALWNRQPEEFDEPEPVKGASAIVQALAVRRTDMQNALDRLERRLEKLVPTLAREFNPFDGTQSLLGQAKGIDPFRVYWLCAGSPDATEAVAREGFAGMMRVRRREPERPSGVDVEPPQPRAIKNKLLGGKLPWTDADVRGSLEDQSTWYDWRTRAAWHRQWNESAAKWNRTLTNYERDVGAVRQAFLDFIPAEQEFFEKRTQDLYRRRTAVSYLLPPQNDMSAFFEQVKQRLLRSRELREMDDAGDLLTALVDAPMWQNVRRTAAERGPVQAVALVRRYLKQCILSLFAEPGERDEQPLLPKLGAVLEAVATGDPGFLDEREIARYRNIISAMLPIGFAPQGSGALKVLIVVPKTNADAQVQKFLEDNLLLPAGAGTEITFTTADTESITVVMFRSGMSLTDVPEVRHVLQVWADAAVQDRPEDHLAWRQRLGWRDDHLAGTPRERRDILQSLLSAMWNDQIKVLRGELESPERIRIGLPERDGGSMVLELEQYSSGISSWAGLLRAYEGWALRDEGSSAREFCERLLQTTPAGLDASGRGPSELFRAFVDEIGPGQTALLDEFAEEADGEDEDLEWLQRLRDFWLQTFEAALDRKVPRPNQPATTLRKLAARWEGTGENAEYRELHRPGARLGGDRHGSDRNSSDRNSADRNGSDRSERGRYADDEPVNGRAARTPPPRRSREEREEPQPVRDRPPTGFPDEGYDDFARRTGTDRRRQRGFEDDVDGERYREQRGAEHQGADRYGADPYGAEGDS